MDQAVVDDQVLPTLEELGVTPAEVGITDAPPGDVPAMEANVRTIAERFESSGVDTVVLVGGSGTNWPNAMETDDSYRPQLLFLANNAVSAFADSADTTDTSVLDGAPAGSYGPAQAQFDEAGIQDCIATLEAAGVEVPAPEDVAANPDDQRFFAAFFPCPEVAVLQGWLEAAGEDLNYGALAAALDTGFEVAMPGVPRPGTSAPRPTPTATRPPTSSGGTKRPRISSWRNELTGWMGSSGVQLPARRRTR